MLVFQDTIIEKICSHAQTEYPKECCGIMLGKRSGEKRIVHKMIQTRNMTEESQSTIHFYINPLEILKTEVLAEEESLEVVGFYHSHPNSEAVASEEDILHMIEGYSYLIISVKNGICIKAKSFEKIMQTDSEVKEEILVKEK